MNNTTPLANLDELVLLCRDDKAKAYIAEAISCYRAGAFRACIVTTWIAVCYDLIDKLRELTLAGDQAAKSIIDEMDRAREIDDFARLLSFERELLEKAQNPFELISNLELEDLKRLRADRNRCAHPSLNSEETAFDPPGELARLHIRSAVTHLLQYPPAQGKYALERLINELDSEYFPRKLEQVVESYKSGPLKNPRKSLVRNFIIILLKGILQDPKTPQRRRFLIALHAVEKMHPQMFMNTMNEKLSTLVRAVPDEEITRVVSLLSKMNSCWESLATDIQNRLETFVDKLPKDKFSSVEAFWDIPCLKEFALKRIKRAVRSELEDAEFYIIPHPVKDRYIELLKTTSSQIHARGILDAIGRNAEDFNSDEQKQIFTIIANNLTLAMSSALREFIDSMERSRIIEISELDVILKDLGLPSRV